MNDLELLNKIDLKKLKVLTFLCIFDEKTLYNSEIFAFEYFDNIYILKNIQNFKKILPHSYLRITTSFENFDKLNFFHLGILAQFLNGDYIKWKKKATLIEILTLFLEKLKK